MDHAHGVILYRACRCCGARTALAISAVLTFCEDTLRLHVCADHLSDSPLDANTWIESLHVKVVASSAQGALAAVIVEAVFDDGTGYSEEPELDMMGLLAWTCARLEDVLAAEHKPGVNVGSRIVEVLDEDTEPLVVKVREWLQA